MYSVSLKAERIRGFTWRHRRPSSLNSRPWMMPGVHETTVPVELEYCAHMESMCHCHMETYEAWASKCPPGNQETIWTTTTGYPHTSNPDIRSLDYLSV